ncbi:YkgJ family cysteine cluster protein [Undibacterium sp. Di26W]|uniref:YkgJ family cysteine cluster protein n=1 Tax=Undibacterium sp. Di26W TaxID=3413035 RepID=UPI003BF28ADA
MLNISKKVRFFRKRIPSFECIPGCHDCCGPVTTSSFEMSALPVKSEAEHNAALTNLSCPYLGNGGCEVYDERPLICRVFGTTPRLLCPHGKRPAEMLDPLVDAGIQVFFLSTRQVLV